MRTSARLAAAVVLVAATLAITLHGADVWDLADGWVIAAAVAAALAGLAEPVMATVEDRSLVQRLQRTRDVELALRGALVTVMHLFGLECDRIGVNAFVVRTHRVRRWLPDALVRVARFRITDSPPPSRVAWTKGKGVIGECWATGRDIGRDLGHDFADFLDAGEAVWLAVPDDVRLGMSYEELQATRQHGAVVATPVLDDGLRVRGVVSIDGPTEHFDAYWSDEARAVLQRAAIAIGGYL